MVALSWRALAVASLLVAGLVPAWSETEPNDAAGQAQALSSGDAVDGAIGAVGDVDYYQIVAERGDRLIVDVDAQVLGSPLDAILDLYDSKGALVATVDDFDGRDPSLRQVIPATGTYVARVGSYGGSEGGAEYAYRLRVAVEGSPDRLEPNDGPEEATPLPLPSTASGAITPAGDADYYRFEGAAGDSVHLDIDAQSLGSPLDAYLELLGADGDPVASSDDSDGRDPAIDALLPAAGTYLAVVTAYGGSSGVPDFTYVLKAWGRGGAVSPPDRQGVTSLWATAVVDFSSQYGNDAWSAAQALGPPDTYPAYGDLGTAWAPSFQDGQTEHLEVAYGQALSIEGVDIYETYNPGAIESVEARDAQGDLHLLWSGAASVAADTSRIFRLRFAATPYGVASIRLTLNAPAVPGWNEIDAIGVIPDLEAAYDPVVTPSKATYRADEAIVVEFSGLPGSAQDWITVVPADASEQTYGPWWFTEGRTSGAVTFDAQAAGAYEVRVYYDWPAGGYEVRARRAFTVQAAPVVRTPQLLVLAAIGARRSASPLLTRVARSLRFSVSSFTAPDTSDLAPVTTYTWEVPAELGTVTGLGQLDLTPVAGVRGAITFRTADATATFAITTQPGPVRTCAIDPPEAVLEPGQQVTFRARALDEWGNAVGGRSFGWYAVGDIGAINGRTGQFTASARPGQGYVIAVVNTVLVFADAEAGASGTGKVVVTGRVPERFALHPNAPNPFNPSTSIRFDLPVSGPVRLTVYDALGRTVERLVDGVLPAGEHRVVWGEATAHASGVYLIRLEAGAFAQTRRMTLAR